VPQVEISSRRRREPAAIIGRRVFHCEKSTRPRCAWKGEKLLA
jgi:hypothetical protein